MGKSMMDTLIPIPKNDADVAPQVPVEVEDLKINREGLVKAAKDLGMVAFKPESLLAAHLMGGTFKKVGVIKIGRTWLYKGAEAASTGIDECNEILAATNDPEVKAAVLPSKLGFAKELNAAANNFIRSAELDGNDDSDKKHGIKPFLAGQPAGPVVIAQQAVVNTTQK